MHFKDHLTVYSLKDHLIVFCLVSMADTMVSMFMLEWRRELWLSSVPTAVSEF